VTVRHGAIQAFLAVLAGAFGAHGLQNTLSENSLHIWQTGVTYHLVHALALCLLGTFEEQRGRKFPTAHAAFGIGIVLFSGSLYALALTQVKQLGMITPFGGTAFLVGWVALAVAAGAQKGAH
jgi:uncharacterized membrane protein YgdD (TMEM256/DUF423 family)